MSKKMYHRAKTEETGIKTYVLMGKYYGGSLLKKMSKYVEHTSIIYSQSEVRELIREYKEIKSSCNKENWSDVHIYMLGGGIARTLYDDEIKYLENCHK